MPTMTMTTATDRTWDAVGQNQSSNIRTRSRQAENSVYELKKAT